MKFKLTTYRTLMGTKEIVEPLKKRTTQWVIYLNNKPTYFVDCFDFKNESNLILNNLILSERKSIKEVIKKIRKTKNIDISLPTVPIFEIKIRSEFKDLELDPLPEEWVS